MIWIAQSEKDTDTAALEKRSRDAADQSSANLSCLPDRAFAA